MAEQSTHDVVNQTRSVGDHSPSDAHEQNTIRDSTGADIPAAEARPDPGDKDRSEQGDHQIQNGSASRPLINGQLNVEPSKAQLSSSDTVTQTDSNTQDSDFDGNISRNQSVGDLSAASDTENRRVERSSASEDTKGQDAGNTVKRPASFKPVSFAKYSAAKVAGINSAAKAAGEKVLSSSANSSTSSLQQGSRPRLVAKSTSGLRDNASKSFKSGGRNGAGGPDPMQVWNKNRPAPPTSTKHLTDEELKQQYGIHMTSRIEADGESKEAKWADIDDDEDDWAPETIEWADGTKVTLNPMSNMPLPNEATKLEKPPGEQPEAAQSERPKVAKAITSVGPNATVLKLGASAGRQQAQKATILQKGPNEKPAPSGAKSPAPVPTKSPWAPLPPVEKVSPITINPQVPVSSSSRHSQVPQPGPSPSIPVAPSPATEISADDFNRSWRDSQPGQPRELFMPSSGKYEAVNETRRRSSRNDQNFRAPALLQRPSPGDQHAPAEPSPAFQTSRISADQERGPWNRRRASSIQSGGSGQFGRRMSVSKGGDTAPPLSDTFQPHRGFSQAGAVEALTSSRGVHVQQNTNLAQAPSRTGLPDAATIAEQKRLMQESARLAVQRRREEEAKEEAAKKERIRLKLEQMGPPPTKGQEQKAETPAAAPKSEEPVAQVSSPPKPPIPEASGEPKQYGMMKVHPPDNVKKFNLPIEKPETSPDIKVSDVASRPKSEPLKISAPNVNGSRPTSEASLDHPSSELQDNIVLGEQNTQSWKRHNAANEPMPGWNSRTNYHGSATSNLWGLPNHDKALGNGTFDQRLTGLSARDISIRNNSQQPSWFNGRSPSHEISPQMPPIPPSSQDNLQSVASFPSPEQRPIAANSEADLQPIGKPLPIGPPQTQASSQRWQHPSNTRAPNTGVAGWNNFHAVAAREDRADNERFRRDLAASREEEARTGIRRAPQYTFNETWKQVEIGEQSGDRQVTSVAKAAINPSFPAAHPYGALGTNLNGDRAMNGLPIRGSRFFPTEARRAVTYSYPAISRSPSPPPAEELGSHHPAYDGDTKTPVINLPVPRAVVKLPKPQQKPTPLPTSSTPPAPPRTFAAAAAAAQPPPPQASLRTVSEPLASTPDWQHRFNDLFGKKPPPKKQVLAVASSSREPLDVVPPNASAAVSLPSKEVDLLRDAGKVTSRDVEELEDLFEDREAASVPLVQLPRDLPEHLSHPMLPPQLRLKGRYFNKPEIDPLSIPPYDTVDDYTPGLKGKDMIFFIHLPGSTTKTIKKPLPRKGGFNNNNHSNNGFMSKGPRNHNTYTRNNSNKNGPPKSRESSGPHQNNSNNRGNNQRTRTPPQGNGSVPTPRAGLSHTNSSGGGWRAGNHLASAGVAH